MTHSDLFRQARTLVVGNWTDAAFALDVAHKYGQKLDVSDIVSLSAFANTEFCPRFLVDEEDLEHIGKGLRGKRVVIVSTSSPHHSRNQLAMRNLVIAGAAKENGAEHITLVEPDLFYSAQDRGPHSTDHPQMSSIEAQKKFDGQAHSARLYAELLKTAGVNQVVTVHNHKPEIIGAMYKQVFGRSDPPPFINLGLGHLVANYVLNAASELGDGSKVGFVAPDPGATAFAERVCQLTGLERAVVVTLSKRRLGQRKVELTLPDSAEALRDRDVFILDDMVRTGGTIASAISLLTSTPSCRPQAIYFYCTHMYVSPEGRENLNSPYLTEVCTTNTLPNVLNRDDQGRLRSKMVVMKIERFLADAMVHCVEGGEAPEQRYGKDSVATADCYYRLDFSSRHQRRAARVMG